MAARVSTSARAAPAPADPLYVDDEPREPRPMDAEVISVGPNGYEQTTITFRAAR